MKLQNVGEFIKGCSKMLGLKEDDIFFPSDLVEGTNFLKVLLTLSKLSKHKTFTALSLK